MTATIIDTLAIELGIEPTKFIKGLRASTEEFTKSKKSLEKDSKDIEHSSKISTESIKEFGDQLLSMAAIITGGLGISEFMQKVTATGVEMRRSALFTGMSAQSLGGWNNLAEQAGGSAGEMTSTLLGLTQQVQQFAATGQSSMLPYLRVLGIDMRNANGSFKDANTLLLDLSRRFQGLSPQQILFYGTQLGLDQTTLWLLKQGPDAVRKYLAEANKMAPTQDQLDRLGAFNMQLKTLEQQSIADGRALFTSLIPALNQTLKISTDLLRLDWHALVLDVGKLLGGILHAVGLGPPVKRVIAAGKKEAAKSGVWGAVSAGLEQATGISFDPVGKPLEPWNSAPADSKQLLEVISGGESAGAGKYSELYGGGHFSGFARHPDKPILITKGPNAGKYSTAAGRYQMLYSTWLEAQKALGLKDFSPASQDKAALWLAQRDYKKRTGHDLFADMRAGTFNLGALSKTWTSLPTGIEANSGGTRALAMLSAAMHRGASASQTSHDNSRHNQTHVYIDTINTKSADAKALANDLPTALKRSSFISLADEGPS